jgi:hypothetical protein
MEKVKFESGQLKQDDIILNGTNYSFGYFNATDVNISSLLRHDRDLNLSYHIYINAEDKLWYEEVKQRVSDAKHEIVSALRIAGHKEGTNLSCVIRQRPRANETITLQAKPTPAPTPKKKAKGHRSHQNRPKQYEEASKQGNAR